MGLLLWAHSVIPLCFHLDVVGWAAGGNPLPPPPSSSSGVPVKQSDICWIKTWTTRSRTQTNRNMESLQHLRVCLIVRFMKSSQFPGNSHSNTAASTHSVVCNDRCFVWRNWASPVFPQTESFIRRNTWVSSAYRWTQMESIRVGLTKAACGLTVRAPGGDESSLKWNEITSLRIRVTVASPAVFSVGELSQTKSGKIFRREFLVAKLWMTVIKSLCTQRCSKVWSSKSKLRMICIVLAER